MSRSDPLLLRVVAIVGGGAVALVLATVHPLGILVGGAAWGVLAPTLRRGVAYGVAFGVVVLIVFVSGSAAGGSLSGVLGTGVLAAGPAVIAVGLGGIGGLARGLR